MKTDTKSQEIARFYCKSDLSTYCLLRVWASEAQALRIKLVFDSISKQKQTVFRSSFFCTGQLVERLRVRLWSGRSEVQNSGRSNRTQCCQRLATAATFLQKELCCPGAMMRRWAPPTRYTLQRITASIMKEMRDLFLIFLETNRGLGQK